MSETRSGAEDVAGSWDTYWLRARHGQAYAGDGGTHPVIISFWERTFATLSGSGKVRRIIDVASGNGALVERVRAAFGEEVFLACLDVSSAALSALTARFAGVRGIVADARNIPLESNSFDVVVSQFGVEYAGLEAIDEAARLVAAGGDLALLLHCQGGGIHRQCANALEAVAALEEARFIPRSIAMFEAGFAAIRGGSREQYDAAAADMMPAVKAVESIIARYGAQVADGTILRLYRDVSRMHERMVHYDAAEVLAWLRGMQAEIAAYRGRMASMSAAAVDEAQFGKLCAGLRRLGFELKQHEALAIPASGVPLAWALIAGRP